MLLQQFLSQKKIMENEDKQRSVVIMDEEIEDGVLAIQDAPTSTVSAVNSRSVATDSPMMQFTRLQPQLYEMKFAVKNESKTPIVLPSEKKSGRYELTTVDRELLL